MDLEEAEAPVPTGRKETVAYASLTGRLFPWDGLQPTLLGIPGSPHLYIPVFKEEDLLRKTLEQGNIHFRSIKMIEDGDEFYDSIQQQRRLGNDSELRIILDPYFLPNGRMRYLELKDGSN